jgi:hypothetical protein
MARDPSSLCTRYALWRAYDEKCYWCREPVVFASMEIDHVLAESLAKEKAKFEAMLKNYGLPATFEVNDFPNWVASCRRCNGSKSAKTFSPVPMFLSYLQEISEKAEDATSREARLLSDHQKSSLLARLSAATERGEISAEDLRAAGANAFKDFEPLLRILSSRTKGLHLEGVWYIVERYGSHKALVVGPAGTGVTAIGLDPDPQLRCESCGKYGPWQGINCIQCGHSQIPDHGE